MQRNAQLRRFIGGIDRTHKGVPQRLLQVGFIVIVVALALSDALCFRLARLREEPSLPCRCTASDEWRSSWRLRLCISWRRRWVQRLYRRRRSGFFRRRHIRRHIRRHRLV